MTSASADTPDLSEEKKAGESAPIIVKEDKRRYLYEGALIVLSVLLALFLNELRNTWQESQRTKEIIENVRNELAKNKATVEGQQRYLTLVLHNIDSAQVHENYRSELFAANRLNFTAIAPEGVFNSGFVDNIAWEIGQRNNIYSKLDFETVSLLAEIYRQQAMIEKGYEMVGEIITSREARDPKRAAETLEMIGYSSYEGYSYGRMPQLLRFYDEALKRLEAY